MNRFPVSRSGKAPLPGARGFNLVELIAVIVILGILAAVAAPRFFERDVSENREFHDEVIATLRYAQKASIAQHRFVCVSFPSNNSITLSHGTDNSCASGTLAGPAGAPYPLVGGNAAFSPLPEGISFDCLGRPRSIGAPPAVALCSDTSAVLTSNRIVQIQGAPPITIERETGYVH